VWKCFVLRDYGSFDIAGEILVDCCREVLGQQCNERFDGAARWSRHLDDGHRMRAALDYDLRASADAREQSREIAGASVPEIWMVAIGKMIA